MTAIIPTWIGKLNAGDKAIKMRAESAKDDKQEQGSGSGKAAQNIISINPISHLYPLGLSSLLVVVRLF